MEKRGILDENTPNSPVTKEAQDKPRCGSCCPPKDTHPTSTTAAAAQTAPNKD